MMRSNRIKINRTTQVLLYPFFNWCAKILIDSSADHRSIDSTQLKGRYVLVANHTGALDPIVMCGFQSYKETKKLIPFQFFVKNSFFRYPHARLYFYLAGGFRAKREMGKKSGLEYAAELAASGQTLAIFPEGKVTRHDRQHVPRKGVELLANDNDVLLLPIRLKWNRKKGLWKSYSMAVGEPFSGKNMTAEQIMDVVYSLKFR